MDRAPARRGRARRARGDASREGNAHRGRARLEVGWTRLRRDRRGTRYHLGDASPRSGRERLGRLGLRGCAPRPQRATTPHRTARPRRHGGARHRHGRPARSGLENLPGCLGGAARPPPV